MESEGWIVRDRGGEGEVAYARAEATADPLQPLLQNKQTIERERGGEGGR